jgi:uncharacterized protein YjbI with pentapeptide repeats
MTERRHDKEHGQLRPFWVVWRGWVVLALVAAGIALVLAVLGWFDQVESVLAPYLSGASLPPASQSQSAKTLWDWMDLLLVPVALAIGAVFLAWVTERRGLEAQQRRIEEREGSEERRARGQREIEADRARGVALQTYFDRMGVLLLNHNLGASQRGDKVRVVAQARTFAALRQLDGERKGLLLQFLYESDLIGKPAESEDDDQRGAIIDLQGADLCNADLAGADLRGADLRGADLFGAKLFGADLSSANLVDAVLVSADLRRACLIDAQLVDADLFDAHLVGADLYDVDLNGANLRRAKLIGADLEGAHLGGADLFGADLFDADLRRANLRRANLVGADLEGARVTDEQLAEAESLEGATLPDGTVAQKANGPGRDAQGRDHGRATTDEGRAKTDDGWLTTDDRRVTTDDGWVTMDG